MRSSSGSRELVGVTCVVGLVTLAIMPTAGQAPSTAADAQGAGAGWMVPRTPWGHPDLEGIWTTDEEYGVPLQRPTQLGDLTAISDSDLATRLKEAEQRSRLEFTDRSTLTDAEKADLPPELGFGPVGDGPEHWFELGKAVSPRSSLITDPPNGRIPPFTQGAKLRVVEPRTVVGFARGKGQGPYNGPEDFDLAERCITRGLPYTWFPQVYNNGFQIVQSPDHVAILYERLHEHRVIPLDRRPHLRTELGQWMGDSRGHWDGDTLVVDVTNFGPQTSYQRSGQTLHLVERYTRVDDTTVTVEITVDDPTTFTRPWTAIVTGKRDADYWQIFEYACHEGNYSLSHMLSAARAEDTTKKDR